MPINRTNHFTLSTGFTTPLLGSVLCSQILTTSDGEQDTVKSQLNAMKLAPRLRFLIELETRAEDFRIRQAVSWARLLWV